MAQVNRYLKDKAMDNIDHALGRPVYPMQESYRNNYAGGNTEVELFMDNPHWQLMGSHSGLHFYSVTNAGRAALANYLKIIGDKTRLFIVKFDGEDMHPIPAETHSKAKYAKWCAWDTFDISFGDFCKATKVRLA